MSYRQSNPLPPTELARALDRGAALYLIDVRTAMEFNGGHIGGSHNVPLRELANHAERLAQLPGSIVLVCRSGARAYTGEALLRRAGTHRVRVLDGGVIAWRDAGHSLVTDPASSRGFLRQAAALFGFGARRDSATVVDQLLAGAE